MIDSVTIIRVQHNRDNPYFMMVRTTAQAKKLSWEALGVLTYLLSQPDNWQVEPKNLETDHCKRDKVRNILDELKATGYLVIEQGRAAKGKFAKGTYIIYEQPITEIPYTVGDVSPITEIPYTVQGGSPITPSPFTVKPTLHNSINTHKREKTKENAGASAPILPSSNPGKKKPAPSKKKPAQPSEKKAKTPPAPPRKRKTELEKWLERAAAQDGMMIALLNQFDAGFDPAMHRVKEFASVKTLEKYVPIAEDLSRLGCLPENVKEIYQWLKPHYNKNGWTIGLGTVAEKFQAWKTWKAQQQRPPQIAPARPAVKSVPVVHNRLEQEQAAANLAAMQSARLKPV